MNPAPPDPIAPGAASQLLTLLAALGGAALSAGLVRLVVRIRGRRGGAADSPSSSPRKVPSSWSRPELRALRRLLGAVLVATVLLPATAALRQLWPHPQLGARLVVIWLVLLVVAAGACLVGRTDDRPGRGRP